MSETDMAMSHLGVVQDSFLGRRRTVHGLYPQAVETAPDTTAGE